MVDLTECLERPALFSAAGEGKRKIDTSGSLLRGDGGYLAKLGQRDAIVTGFERRERGSGHGGRAQGDGQLHDRRRGVSARLRGDIASSDWRNGRYPARDDPNSRGRLAWYLLSSRLFTLALQLRGSWPKKDPPRNPTFPHFELPA